MALAGLGVPVPTLFDDDGAIDADRNRRFADGLVRAGVDHLFLLGTLGEFPSVDEAERAVLLRVYGEAARGGTDLWVGIGAPATRRAVRQARAAAEVGATALVAVPPYYLRPTPAAILDYYRAIHAASGVPLLAYNIPAKVGYALPPDLVERLAEEGVLSGVKDTAGSLSSVQAFLAAVPKGCAVFPGDDAFATAALRGGAAGAVMGTANVVPRLALEVLRNARAPPAPDHERPQQLIDLLAEAFTLAPFPAVVKALANHLRNTPVGYRAPYVALTDEEAQRVFDAVEPITAELDPYLREA